MALTTSDCGATWTIFQQDGPNHLGLCGQVLSAAETKRLVFLEDGNVRTATAAIPMGSPYCSCVPVPACTCAVLPSAAARAAAASAGGGV